MSVLRRPASTSLPLHAHELLKAMEADVRFSRLEWTRPLPASAIMQSRVARHPVKSKNKVASAHPSLLNAARVRRPLSSATGRVRLDVSNFAGVASNDTSRK
jgi:hypothetical protein